MLEETTQCLWCQRPKIVVDKKTGWMMRHHTKEPSKSGKPKGPICEGTDKHRDSRPEVSNA